VIHIARAQRRGPLSCPKESALARAHARRTGSYPRALKLDEPFIMNVVALTTFLANEEWAGDCLRRPRGAVDFAKRRLGPAYPNRSATRAYFWTATAHGAGDIMMDDRCCASSQRHPDIVTATSRHRRLYSDAGTARARTSKGRTPSMHRSEGLPGEAA